MLEERHPKEMKICLNTTCMQPYDMDTHGTSLNLDFVSKMMPMFFLEIQHR